MSWLSSFIPQAGGGGDLNFEHASDIEAGDPADTNGTVFDEVIPNDDGTITFVTSQGHEFTKQPDDLVFSPK